mmetsp:Transcript_126226/g.243339  ORF Transcript_126226/g.243339 Transcript_126226/m.243339 type:complete len:783 (-) Transcript_126226:288-2636(-)
MLTEVVNMKLTSCELIMLPKAQRDLHGPAYMAKGIKMRACSKSEEHAGYFAKQTLSHRILMDLLKLVSSPAGRKHSNCESGSRVKRHQPAMMLITLLLTSDPFTAFNLGNVVGTPYLMSVSTAVASSSKGKRRYQLLLNEIRPPGKSRRQSHFRSPRQMSGFQQENAAREPVHVAWLRIGDLRLRDNPALWHAAQGGAAVLPAFVWCPAEDRLHACPGQESEGHRDWSYEGTTLQAMLATALRNLDLSLYDKYRNRLCILGKASRGQGSAAALVDAAQTAGATVVHYNRREEPAERRREEELELLCKRAGIQVRRHSAFLFRDPEHCPIFAAVGNGLHVFKAFWDGWHKGGPIRSAYPAPKNCPGVRELQHTMPFGGHADPQWPFGDMIPKSRVTGRMLASDMNKLAEHWDISEEGAHKALAEFQALEGGLTHYKGSITRDAGPKAKESRLSPFFRLGLLSMVDVWGQIDRSSPQAKKWFRRCAWRDYAYWMLYHWPDLPEVPMRPAYQRLGCTTGPKDASLAAWQQGMTGYPLVDAAMRELRQTGYIQQNMRHTVGQFLVEVLGADWRDGEEWFHLALADSDLAINAMMWQHQGLTGVSQWLVGIDCHPVRHAKAADPQGDYVRQWVPELANLPCRFLHCPWEAPAATLAKAGVSLGSSYPNRVVEDVDAARACYLERAVRCRNDAPQWFFSDNGFDLLTNPNTSGLSAPGIRALTEKCFRSEDHAEFQYQGRGKRRSGTLEAKKKSQGRGKGKRRTRSSSSPRTSDTAAASTRQEEHWII